MSTLLVIGVGSYSILTKAFEADTSVLAQDHKVDVNTGQIAVDKLPINIHEYVKANFKDYVIKRAEHDPLCTGADAIDVAIEHKGSPKYSVIFLPNGDFVQLEEDMPLIKAPTKIIDVVKTKFASYSVAPEIERLTLADNTVQFLVDISNAKGTKEVILNIDGTLVCEH